MALLDILRANLLSPFVLAFALGIGAKLLRSDLVLPKDVYHGLAFYLLLALGLKGGVELSDAPLGGIALPAAATLLLGVVTPIVAYGVLRMVGRFSTADSAGIAAHYGSVSAVTFIAALEFVRAQGAPAEPYMATLLTLLESPGIAVALLIGSVAARGDAAPGDAPRPLLEVVHEVLTGRTMLLLVGGLLIGVLIGHRGYEPIAPMFDGLFKGALVLFLLEMGVVAGDRLQDLRRVGPFLLGFGILLPIAHGALGTWLGTLSGLSPSGATVLGTMAASASYIAAPSAVRMTLPQANPTYYLTSSLAITFPFNLVLGIPLYYRIAQLLAT